MLVTLGLAARTKITKERGCGHILKIRLPTVIGEAVNVYVHAYFNFASFDNEYLLIYLPFSTETGEPNNAEGNEACLEIYGRGFGYTWNDLFCHEKNNGYICMKGGIYKNSQL